MIFLHDFDIFQCRFQFEYQEKMNLMFFVIIIWILSLKPFTDYIYVYNKYLNVKKIIDLNGHNESNRHDLVDSLELMYLLNKLCNNRYLCLSTKARFKTIIKRKRVTAVNLKGYPNQPLLFDPLDINSSSIDAYKEKYKIKTRNV